MVEVIAGVVLAIAAGLNAYIPLLGVALLARFTPLITLPENWTWLELDWVMWVLGGLLALEVLVDKFPVLDTVNDVLQTLVRPASGGMVFSIGVSSETAAVTDPQAMLTSEGLWPFLIGIGVALIPHVLKAIVRPVVNVVTGGAGAAVTSAAEDIGAVALTVLALVAPVAALVGAVIVLILLVRRLRRAIRRRREARAGRSLPAA
ncbi:hypothetical protein GCM10009847_25980 [Leucobacter tardus]|uniref:DUF4126 domain-containing protein n=1 Tax=Leucobacter tardus TaxID=501483 RepID=A0A939QD05_9MICO|nr:DUF4126 domain-containing protein [Leucobacter tardus]MBO2989897.1 DUF4126 domain-containing protein [Leucobacter tardus]